MSREEKRNFYTDLRRRGGIRVNCVQRAVVQIELALELLNEAKENLRYARNGQHIPVAAQIAALEETLDVLKDPECTPEYYEEDDSHDEDH